MLIRSLSVFQAKNSVFGDKLRSDDSLNYFKNSDIVILSELQGHEVEHIPNFEIIAISAPRKISHCKIWQILWRGPNSSSNLENHINTSRKDYYVLLAVTLIPVQNDFIFPDSCNFVLGESFPMPKMVPLQKSFDHHLNGHGKILLEQCKSLDIRILNGRMQR